MSDSGHKTFFHRDCEGGMKPRIYSNGTVEASWYLPTGSDGEHFDSMFTILNLRGDFREYSKQANWICTLNQPVFILIDLQSLKSQYHENFLTHFEKLETRLVVVCIIADNLKSVGECKAEIQTFHESLKIIENKICDILMNWNNERLLSFGELKFLFQSVIVRLLKIHENEFQIKKLSIANITTHFQQKSVFIDETEPECQNAYSSAKRITDNIKMISPGLTKVSLLCLQGKPWRSWTKI